jgi:hypothetical protein
MKIVNLTQHPATPEQIAAGVMDLNSAALSLLKKLIIFEVQPSKDNMRAAADIVADIAVGTGADAAMVGGPPFFASTLEMALKVRNIKPLYSFSRRETIDEIQDDDSLKEVSVFKHAGFIEV